MYICKHIYVYVDIFTHVHMYTYIYICICIYIYEFFEVNAVDCNVLQRFAMLCKTPLNHDIIVRQDTLLQHTSTHLNSLQLTEESLETLPDIRTNTATHSLFHTHTHT